ncbi:hypothetical protein JMJ58_01660 [Haloterrigena salifodinae]|uniref:Uncharacterized protein n=1 Tax=Haloterrigena salifodinae TaxID=2675099 RepID=A0A8T8E222_9EURY|nr:hypothetical protein [Haloterrigena salifodinae]QRV15637.1 hypothetical protein JMJ58_01660 [Haloterrigena salifodinae]
MTDTTDTRDPDEFVSEPVSSIPATHDAIELRDEMLVYDRKDPDRWVQSTESISLKEFR